MVLLFTHPSKGAKIGAVAGAVGGAISGAMAEQNAKDQREAYKVRVDAAKAELEREKFNLEQEKQQVELVTQQQAALKQVQELQARYQALRDSGLSPQQIDGLKRVAAFQKRVGMPSPLGLIEGSDYTSLNTPDNMAIFEKLSPQDRQIWLQDIRQEQDQIRKQAEEKKVAGIAGKMMAGQNLSPEEGQQLIAGMLATGQTAEAERLLRAKVDQQAKAAVPELQRGQLMQRADKAITESKTILEPKDQTRVMHLRWRMENDPFMTPQDLINAVGEIEVLSAGPNAKAYVESVAQSAAQQAARGQSEFGGPEHPGMTPNAMGLRNGKPASELAKPMRPIAKLKGPERALVGKKLAEFLFDLKGQPMTPEQHEQAIASYLRSIGIEADEEALKALLEEVQKEEPEQPPSPTPSVWRSDRMLGAR